MILTRRSIIFWLLFFIMVSFGALGGAACHYLLRSTQLTPVELKFIAERFLFFTFVAGGVFLVFGFGIIYRSVNFSRSLDKLLTLSRSSGYSPDSGLRKLGVIGKKLADISYEMNSLSEKKSRKIGSLNALCDTLTAMMPEKIIVLSANGTILYVSRGILKNSELPRTEFIGKKVETLVTYKKIRPMLEDVFRTRTETVLPAGEGTLIPVITHQNETAYVICVFEKGVRLVTPPALTQNGRKGAGASIRAVGSGIGRVFKTIRRPKT